ncbi:phosphatase PAP2 family protein [Actinokineospora xionganensis]|uniref:Phosphatidic acid phosphatase n=1 Tax=Actinokineospora xionganensis TaxID=2684470 RepID=A0ABR7L9X4_9PSEU|nr:phosphatase PAP2 family protein [Actinokineospora xionganensis]MBC6449506.1 phosphatidic acid phosphatase [Actinokineospora xionganensis]
MERPLLTAPRFALTLAVLFVLAMAVIGVDVAGNTAEGPFDKAVFDVMTRRPDLAIPLTLCTHPAAMVAVIAIMAAIAVRAGRPKVAVLAVLGPVLAAGINTVALKPLFNRTHQDTLAYPSGHTTTLVAILTVIVLVAAANSTRAQTVRTAVIAFGLYVVGAGAIVGREFHYLTDTIGALFWGVAAVIVLAALIDLAAKRVGDTPSVR